MVSLCVELPPPLSPRLTKVSGGSMLSTEMKSEGEAISYLEPIVFLQVMACSGVVVSHEREFYS
ncbi:hypothetical protein TIFTF001_007937 [Ficus carica]|uniref:Uncharacterized protein n=1 Tax=Ficus carica TaxID=3494 RepID=A0AA88D1B3_FICCA|nr:hypothetical protein TIFTF001_007937 [Ficus carica]